MQHCWPLSTLCNRNQQKRCVRAFVFKLRSNKKYRNAYTCHFCKKAAQRDREFCSNCIKRRQLCRLSTPSVQTSKRRHWNSFPLMSLSNSMSPRSLGYQALDRQIARCTIEPSQNPLLPHSGAISNVKKHYEKYTGNALRDRQRWYKANSEK